MFTQRSKLIHAEIIALVQTDDIGRLNYVQLPKKEKMTQVYLLGTWGFPFFSVLEKPVGMGKVGSGEGWEIMAPTNSPSLASFFELPVRTHRTEPLLDQHP